MRHVESNSYIRKYTEKVSGRKYCTDLTVNILKAYSSDPESI